MMKRFCKLSVLIVLMACLIGCAFFIGNATVANAQEVDVAAPAEPVQPPVTDGEEIGEDGLKTLVNGFIEQLKEKYGEDYQKYYDAIIADWGSVEAYLLSLAKEDTADAVADGWTYFVKWLGEYSPVWGSILAVALVIVVIIFGKKALQKVTGYVTGTGAKFKTLFAEVNKIDAAQAAQNAALIKLLGENEKFKDERAALQNSAGDLKNDEL